MRIIYFCIIYDKLQTHNLQMLITIILEQKARSGYWIELLKSGTSGLERGGFRCTSVLNRVVIFTALRSPRGNQPSKVVLVILHSTASLTCSWLAWDGNDCDSFDALIVRVFILSALDWKFNWNFQHVPFDRDLF